MRVGYSVLCLVCEFCFILENVNGKNERGKDSFKDGFDLEKHLKETKKNYRHLVHKR